MLEAEEVDDDYFTPVAKTSLANIFKKPLPNKKNTDNETLKYSPPAPVQNPTQRLEDLPTKKIENICSCVFDAYLWLDNVYTHKGKLGCAVVKFTKDESISYHSILLYDSKKATVSSAAVTKDLEVTVKGKDFISYYDHYEKYWCLYGSENDINKILDVLKTFNVKIKGFKESGNDLPEITKPETTDVKTKNTTQNNLGSDTDSSINRKTKASIINRIFKMGQSVLPPRAIPNEQTSDSSDTNESDNHIIPTRSKPVKNTIKRHEKNVSEQHLKSDTIHKKAIVPHIQHSMENNTCMIVNDKLIPLQSSSVVTSSSGNDLNFFLAEQRISNSELRINMTRMTDKVDNILSKINNLEIKDKNEGSSFNNEILQKLLGEYEKKIKNYEELLQNVDKTTNTSQSHSNTDLLESKEELLMNKELAKLKNNVTKLNKCIEQRNDKITLLYNEIQNLRESNNLQSSRSNEGELQAISELEQTLLEKNEMLSKLTIENDELVRKSNDDQLENKIKTIMNDTFQAVAVNFDNNESYSGERVKNIIAAVIKKVTIESLNKSK